MSRAQAIVHRDNRVLLVQHSSPDHAYWCLPGGAIEPGESPAAAAARELFEECGVVGTLVRPTAVTIYAPGDEHHTFLFDIADQIPTLGHDPELAASKQILTALVWLTLPEIPARDRRYLWTAGLLTIRTFFDEPS